MAAGNHRTPRSQEPILLKEPHGSRPAPLSPQLGIEPTGIIDREEDLAAISSLLLAGEVRLLTLTGPAGVGKTRLAREVGRQVAGHFPHGVVFVDLTPVRDPVLVLPALAEQLGVRNAVGPPLIERLQAFLSHRELLVILDNLEQILPGDVGLGGLLAAAPDITLLVTSREPLHLLWEQLYHVPPLAVPDPAHLPPLDELGQIPSVALFVRRARMLDPTFRLSAANAQAVAELVVHLDGLPLAIKLAAARTPLLSPPMLLERLGQRLSLLHWEAPDLPARQHTLRAAIGWSYDHLPSAEQRLFRSLGVLVGGFELEAAEAVAAQVRAETIEVLEGLSSLVDKSLVQREEDGQGGYRFRLLESVQEFALERLAAAGELEAARRSHALYYLTLGERAEPELTGPGQRRWFLQLEGTLDNLRTALAWLLDHEEAELGLRLAVAVAHFWEIRGYLSEGRRWLETALSQAPSAAPALRARALTWLGAILVMSVDRPGADESDQALRAEKVLTDGLGLARTVGDGVSIARALTFLGVLSLQTGEWDRGKRALEEAQTYLQETGHDRELIQAVLPLGVIAFLQGRDDEALRLMNEILSRYQEVGDDWGRSVALLFSMTVVATWGDLARAVGLAEELLTLGTESQSGRILYLAAVGTAWLLRCDGDPERLAGLVGGAESLDQAAGLVSSLMERVHLAPTREALQARMGQEALDAAVRAGRHRTFSQVAALIRALLEEAHQVEQQQEPEPEKVHPGLLSQRELEVLHLVAEGRSNKQIAHELIIAESTVRYHLTSVFNKLGVDTRTHALAVAAQRGLIQLGQDS